MKPNEILDELRDEYIKDFNKKIGITGISDEYLKTLKTDASIVFNVLTVVDTHNGVEKITAVLAAAPDNLGMSDNEIIDAIINHEELISPVNKYNIIIGRYDEN